MIQPLDRIAVKLDMLIAGIGRLTSEIIGLRLEMAAARERWEGDSEEVVLDELRNRPSSKNP